MKKQIIVVSLFALAICACHGNQNNNVDGKPHEKNLDADLAPVVAELNSENGNIIIDNLSLKINSNGVLHKFMYDLSNYCEYKKNKHN